ncbi:MAG: TRAP transporter substrate-binding protein [Candidatus Eremiobacteraeota bacterium]|nr:TRAP transporter substrate-binding protein [Candidatus Eremiobacteraeota bacterium]
MRCVKKIALPTRRAAIAGAAAFASIAIVRSPLRAAEITWKYGSPAPIDHPLNIDARKMFEEIKAATNGRFEVQVFPNSELGGDTALLTQLRSGAVQMLHFTGGIMASVVPLAAIDGVGFIFKSRAQAFATMDGDVGALVRAQMLERGIYGFPNMWENGYRQITSSTHPIRTAADLAGFRIRTPASAIWLDLFKTLGANPTPMNFAEVYTALQTHIIDGQENPYAIIETGKVYEVQKYLSVTNHMWTGYWLIANNDAWKALPADIRSTAERVVAKWAKISRDDTGRYNDSLAEKLKTQGLTFNDADTSTFRAKLGPFYAKQKDVFGAQAWSALERSVGKLT